MKVLVEGAILPDFLSDVKKERNLQRKNMERTIIENIEENIKKRI